MKVSNLDWEGRFRLFMLFKKVAQEYLKYLENENYKDLVMITYRINRIIRFFEKYQFHEITLDLISEFKRTFPNRVPKYVNVHVSQIRMMFKYASERKIKTKIDYKNIKYLPEPYKVVDFLDQDQVRKLLEFFGGESYHEIRDRALIAVYLDTGIRLNECLALNRNQLPDIYNGMLKIVGKFSKERYAMFTWSILYIKEYMDTRKDDHEALFATEKRGKHKIRRLKDDWIQQRLREATTKLGFKITVHKLRRTAITNWVNNGMDIKDASFLAGHDSVKTTEKHYLGINWNRLKKVHKKHSLY